MPQTASLIFPHQLFKDNPCIAKGRRIFIVEDPLFFTELPFHKMKLMLHHASMKYYSDYLRNLGYRVIYLELRAYVDMETFFRKTLHDEGITSIHYCEPVDFLLEKRLNRFAAKYGLTNHTYSTPNFLNSRQENEQWLEGRTSYFLFDFYKHQRKKWNILMDGTKPLFEKWSFDEQNRKPLPKGIDVPLPYLPYENTYVSKARQYVEENFPHHPGETREFFYPTTFEEAKRCMEHYFSYRFHGFGSYQDALSEEYPFVFHSLFSAAINCGLLNPGEVIDYCLEVIPINAQSIAGVEGFVRQILGWREFVRAVYEHDGVRQRTRNFWNHTQPIHVEKLKQMKPVRLAHEKVLRYGYTHHIERLMVLGNFFLLTETHPDEVYRYFMTYYIDAYDWVMVPNVYGMSQYADGGLMVTKPYISSSAYLDKQGYNRKEEWGEVWDALYWRFLDNRRAYFVQNKRSPYMLANLNRKSAEELEAIKKTAENFLRL
jgi:deoxyribodipyrimidine photolyase-related protein